MTKKAEKKLKITLVKSTTKCIQSHKDCVQSLGLRRIRHSVEFADSAIVRGMINKVSYLLKVEEV